MEKLEYIKKLEVESLLLIRDQICHYQDIFKGFNYYSYPLHSLGEKLDSLLDDLEINFPEGSIGEYLSQSLQNNNIDNH